MKITEFLLEIIKMQNHKNVDEVINEFDLRKTSVNFTDNKFKFIEIKYFNLNLNTNLT